MAPKPRPVPDAVTAAAPTKKSSKKIIAIIVVLILVIAGAAAWYFLQSGNEETAEIEAQTKIDYRFFTLEPFTVNLQREESDHFLQVGITLKVANAKLEEQLKQHLPEIRSHLLLLLSSKHASELSSVSGKIQLSHEIIAQIQSVLGLPTDPVNTMNMASNLEGNETESTGEATPGVTAETQAPPLSTTARNQDMEVLFTSFIIQ